MSESWSEMDLFHSWVTAAYGAEVAARCRLLLDSELKLQSCKTDVEKIANKCLHEAVGSVVSSHDMEDRLFEENATVRETALTSTTPDLRRI